MRSVVEFKDTHLQQDIWVIAAGSSMNYINPEFFANKVTIGVNRICMKFDCDYLVAKDGRGFSAISNSISDKTKIILSKHESGNLHQNINTYTGEYWLFDHPAKPQEKPDLSCINKESTEIVVSYSTITSAIHLAAYMGAANIMICGHDCGTIDNIATIDGYYDTLKPHQGTEEAYIRWLSEIENHTTAVCHTITKNFNCNIHSLNPFINFNLEGHKYTPSNRGKIFQRKLRS
jgi:hypothetical protein